MKNIKNIIILRPQEVANSPEVARRIGVIAMTLLLRLTSMVMLTPLIFAVLRL
mgnify:CR=1 FL=1